VPLPGILPAAAFVSPRVATAAPRVDRECGGRRPRRGIDIADGLRERPAVPAESGIETAKSNQDESVSLQARTVCSWTPGLLP